MPLEGEHGVIEIGDMAMMALAKAAR